MSNYDNTNRGAIWPNKDRQKDTHPHFTGSLNVDGVEYWVSGWKKEDGANEKAPSLSFSVKKKEAKEDNRESAKPKAKEAFDDFEDDIPF